jgi:hypothetical protein
MTRMTFRCAEPHEDASSVLQAVVRLLVSPEPDEKMGEVVFRRRRVSLILPSSRKCFALTSVRGRTYSLNAVTEQRATLLLSPRAVNTAFTSALNLQTPGRPHHAAAERGLKRCAFAHSLSPHPAGEGSAQP